jgi:hypothetical protein
MNNRSYIMAALCILLIAISTNFSCVSKDDSISENKKNAKKLSNYAWITKERNTVTINVTKAVAETSNHHSDLLGGHQRFIDDDGIKTLDIEGSYNGKYFSISAYDRNETIFMKQGNKINPNDGVLEGFALFRKEGGALVFYLFVDEDWKKHTGGNMNIVWREKGSLKHRRFDFSNKQHGIYIDRITDDNWFGAGRLFFGDISMDDVRKSKYNKSFIIIS